MSMRPMDIGRSKKVDPEIQKRIAHAVENSAGQHLEALVLYGSRARGDAKPDSDWDVLVLLKDSADLSSLRIAVRSALFDAAESLGILIEPIVMRWSDIHQNVALMRNIAEEGIAL